MPLNEPLPPAEVRKLVREILKTGTLRWSTHGLSEMAADRLENVDVVNVLRGGIAEPGEWENGSWRYRVHTQRIYVVIAFRSKDVAVVVTAWRIQQ